VDPVDPMDLMAAVDPDLLDPAAPMTPVAAHYPA